MDEKVYCTCKPWRDIDGTHHLEECEITQVLFFGNAPKSPTFKIYEVDRDVTAPGGNGYGKGSPFIVFHAQIADAPPTMDPCELEDLAGDAVLKEASYDFAFVETEWVNDRTVAVTAFKF